MINDYLKKTKKKIGNYYKSKDLLELRRKDMMLLEAQIEMTDELSRERIKRNIKCLSIQISDMANDIEAIDKGLLHLDPIAREIIHLKYRKKESWVAVGLATGYGQSRAKEIGKESLMVVGEYLYGIEIHQDLPIVAGAGCY